VEILGEGTTTDRARTALHRLMPAAAGIAQALITLGIKPEGIHHVISGQ